MLFDLPVSGAIWTAGVYTNIAASLWFWGAVAGSQEFEDKVQEPSICQGLPIR
jgi:hypothetical protein